MGHVRKSSMKRLVGLLVVFLIANLALTASAPANLEAHLPAPPGTVQLIEFYSPI